MTKSSVSKFIGALEFRFDCVVNVASFGLAGRLSVVYIAALNICLNLF